MELVIGILTTFVISLVYFTGYYNGINKTQKKILGSFDSLINDIKK